MNDIPKFARETQVSAFEEEDETIVSMIEFKGKILIATNKRIYELREKALFRLNFETVGTD